jgi:hypothetical protein
VKVLICGSRNWTDEKAIFEVVGRLPSGTTVITGGARGADRIADDAAASRGLARVVENADWDRYGKRAGFIRNVKMLDMLTPQEDEVIAFWDGESRGTEHTIRAARERGIKVTVCLSNS